MNDFYKSILNDLKIEDNFRFLNRKIKQKIDFTSNDYLNLRFDKDNLETGIEYAKKFGNSISSSRILGENECYFEIENLLSKIKKKQKTIIFPSGFQLNFTVINALIKDFKKEEIAIFSDKLNHSSIQLGIELSRQRQYRYKNNDLNHLEDLLKKNKKKYNFVITEGVFSMDGTVLNMNEMKFLKEKYNFYLYIDDAHGFGLFGDNGYGISENYEDIVDFSVGTFSKAIGSQGGYFSCNDDIYNIIINKAKGFIYSTGLSPFSVGIAYAAIKKISKMNKERNYLNDLANYCRKKIIDNGFNILNSRSQIIPIILNKNKKKDQIIDYFYNNNISISYIKSPTVPLNLERIRISLNILHKKEDIDYFVDVLKVFS